MLDLDGGGTTHVASFTGTVLDALSNAEEDPLPRKCVIHCLSFASTSREQWLPSLSCGERRGHSLACGLSCHWPFLLEMVLEQPQNQGHPSPGSGVTGDVFRKTLHGHEDSIVRSQPTRASHLVPLPAMVDRAQATTIRHIPAPMLIPCLERGSDGLVLC